MTLGSHQRSIGKSQQHLKPRWLLDRLGAFDLDPCAANHRPWDCAEENWTESGLDREWHGMVWLNPPFDRCVIGLWIQKMALHGNGMALLHARTETGWFKPCWESATALLFLGVRVKFCTIDGVEQRTNSGAPVVLVAFGRPATERLRDCIDLGVLVTEWSSKPKKAGTSSGNTEGKTCLVATPADSFCEWKGVRDAFDYQRGCGGFDEGDPDIGDPCPACGKPIKFKEEMK